MKKMYWTAYNFHPYLMSLLCVASLLCLFVVEKNKKRVPQPHYSLKLEAANKAQAAFDEIKKYRHLLGIRINKKHDIAESGLIGVKSSPITSDHGVLRSKQISLNPNLAALIIQWFKDLKLKEGDVVAVGMTGSFPALDISTLAAIDAMKLKPLIIVSATASEWGANIPRFSWLDMMMRLHKRKIFPYTPLAASIGASQDQGKNLESKGLNIILNTIKRHKIPLIREPLVSLSIDKRLELYEKSAEGKHIKAYINIGGGIASIGRHFAKPNLTKEQKELILSNHLDSGINQSMPVTLANSNSVAIRYLKLGVPVVNIKDISHIAKEYDLQPWHSYMLIGVGPLFFHLQYNIWLAVISLLIIVAACWLEKKAQLKQKQAEADEIGD